MQPFEFILTFASILVGLAIADIAASLHRLLRARSRVKWDWLPLAVAAFVVLTVIQFWWSFYAMGRAAAWTSYGRFLPLVALLMVMFLLASAALPDEVPSEGVDLTIYYANTSRYFWSLFALFIVLAVAVGAIAYGGGGIALLMLQVKNVLFLAVLVSLAVVKRRGYHATVIVLLLLVLGYRWSQLSLVSPGGGAAEHRQVSGTRP